MPKFNKKNLIHIVTHPGLIHILKINNIHNREFFIHMRGPIPLPTHIQIQGPSPYPQNVYNMPGFFLRSLRYYDDLLNVFTTLSSFFF